MALKKKFFSKIKKPYIIGEIASAHLGDTKNLLYLSNKLKQSNSNALKFQIFKTENFVSKYNNYFKILKKIEINYKNWEYIFNKTKKLKINKICEIFEFESLVFAHKSNYFDCFKISISNLYEEEIIEYINKYQLPLVINISGAEIKELKKIINKIKNQDICLMLGYQNFPTKINDIELNKIAHIKKNFPKFCIGYADHIDANMNFFAQAIPLMAISMGADVIEKHINMDRSKKKNDYYSSLNPDEFKSFVSNVRNAYLAIGNEKFIVSKAEKKYLNFAKKYLVAKKKLKKGHFIKNNDVSFKRVNKQGIDEREFKKLIKPKLNKNINEDKIIQINDIIK
jgi:N,N'-diacetyllegionaminate synthase